MGVLFWGEWMEGTGGRMVMRVGQGSSLRCTVSTGRMMEMDGPLGWNIMRIEVWIKVKIVQEV